MLDILLKWNRWGVNPLKSGHKRDITDRVIETIELPETVVLTGMRRSGKTTVLYQVMDALEAQGIPQKAMFHLNFEDPSLSGHLTPYLLDDLYRLYREEIYPTGKAYFFLDEIQVVPEWERWVTARNETENIKFFITGSSGQIMSRELATLLTGRHVDVRIHPLSFKECLAFKEFTIPNAPLSMMPPPEIQAALKAYLIWGGMPRVVLTENENNKRSLLRGYLDDILFKDIALRHDIRNMNLLRDLAIYLFTQTSCSITFKRLAAIYDVSQSIIQHYCDYLEEAFLANYLSIYSQKAAEINRNPKKMHCQDLGFRYISNLSSSLDLGKLAETCVYHQLTRLENDGIYYWKNTGEVDFVVRLGIEPKRFIQVVYDGLDQEGVLHRETRSLIEAHQQYPNAEKWLITAVWPRQSLKSLPEFIRVIPLWQFLLS